jgi:hypothetical protein
VSILWLVAIAAGHAATAGQLSDTFTNWLAHPAIEYGTRPTRDPIARLNREIEAGRRQLKADGPSGYLKSLLDALNVPIESQVVVFVKDSVQALRISRTNPRAIFFNDSVAVGWVRGGFIELASQDPEQGVIFYTLTSTWTGKPQFSREDTCLACHYSYSTSGVPGMLMRSSGQFEADHRVPFAQRWGGWYVTGQHGSLRHMGNADIDKLYEDPRPADTFNWASLGSRFDTNGYLSPHSDMAALTVFQHQMHMMNLLSRIGWEARVGEYERRTAKLLLPGLPVSEKAPVSLTEAAREVVDYMLFVDEAPLADTIKGSTDFATTFAARGPRDRKGRSLRHLDLERRLLRYPCSYMIYTELFDALPAEAKAALYQRLWQILSGQENSPKYARLSAVDRQAIIEILYDTKDDLPAYFQPGARIAN